MEKFVYYGILFDIYKELLTDNEMKIFSLYYEENLTLQEIADILDVSKSYIGNVIKKCENKLDSLEKILKIYYTRDELSKILQLSSISSIKNKIQELIK